MFTLRFSLAVNVCRHVGIEPVERVELKDEEVGYYIEHPMHSLSAPACANPHADRCTAQAGRLAKQLAMRVGSEE